ncbi:hypothetical protein CLV31_13014 [Algoriphagus aquaeductus]|uniref:Uncharacterized protein n=1 Tax=Algoriphagus aquaeductus TaxID=475299 RepID=A0A326RMA1_9BACT|nr:MULTISPECIES: hypothetical protein [Algoriphagus]PZV75758.1 hypothetical protein CLV31_13014 [Algoriphagus aquaeductus]
MWNKQLQSGKKFIAFGILLLGLTYSPFSKAENLYSKSIPSSESELLEGIEVKIEKIKPQPSIILVDKNLDVIAEFYGDQDFLKSQFVEAFDNSSLLATYKTQRIYLITPEKSIK